MRTTLRLMWAWTLSALVVSACATAPTAPPVVVPSQPPATEIVTPPVTVPPVTPVPEPPVVEPEPTRATLAIVAHDYVRPDMVIVGADVEVKNGAEVVATGQTNIDGYFAVELERGHQYDVIVSFTGYDNGTASEYLVGNHQMPIALRQKPPPYVITARPLVGPLRVQSKFLRDDAGYRRVFFASWFTALRELRDNPDEFQRQIDAIAAAGYQGARVFLAVGGWSDFWDNHEVVPIPFQKWFYTGSLGRSDRLGAQLEAWSDYEPLLRTMAREFKKRSLRLDITFGDMQIIVGNDQAKELALHRWLSGILAEEGGLDVVALVEGTNEFPINRYGADGDASIEQLGRVLAIWRDAIPGVLTTEGAIVSEEPERLYAGARFGQVSAVHVGRDPFEMCLKRTFGLTNWEGDWRHFPVPFWNTEPAGPGRDSFAAQNDPANLTALYAMHALLGQGSNYFNGPAVRGDGPLESTWGFAELPKILAVLPEDVGTWDHASDGRGGIMYFFHGKDFATSTIAAWNTTPPKPVAEWTLYSGDQVTSGTGTPPQKVTGLLVGRFQ